ncbi:hypothetical protein [Blastomonas sp. SL216]|nr:hypothetical protein OU999_06995 [Blastomonas sp. SL216]
MAFQYGHDAIEPQACDRNFAVHLPMIDHRSGTEHPLHDHWSTGYGA